MSLSRWPGRVKGPEAGRPLSIHLCCRVVQFVGNLSHQAVKNLAAVVPLPTPQRDKCLKTWALVAALKLHHQGNLAVLLDLPMLCTSDLRNFLMELSSDKADRSRLHDASAKTVKLWATKGLVHVSCLWPAKRSALTRNQSLSCACCMLQCTLWVCRVCQALQVT